MELIDETREASLSKRALLLSGVDLLSSLDAPSLTRLAAQIEAVALPAEAIVMRQDEVGDCVYVVSRGKFGVFVSPGGGSPETRVATIGPGEYLGEMALLTDQPRSATVRADEAGELLRLTRLSFLNLIAEQPHVVARIFSMLSARLRTANSAIVRLTEAARLVETNMLTREDAAQLAGTEGADEVSRLSQAFGRMAQQVISREEQLRQEVQQLRIEIDQAKRDSGVAEICESDFFQELQQKARLMRQARAS